MEYYVIGTCPYCDRNNLYKALKAGSCDKFECCECNKTYILCFEEKGAHSFKLEDVEIDEENKTVKIKGDK